MPLHPLRVETGYEGVVKHKNLGLSLHLIDTAASAAILVALSPLMLLLAVAVKLDSPGPAFCPNERLNAEGRRYLSLKFCVRRSGLGTILRQFSLDELPGFIGVLLGEARLADLLRVV